MYIYTCIHKYIYSVYSAATSTTKCDRIHMYIYVCVFVIHHCQVVAFEARHAHTQILIYANVHKCKDIHIYIDIDTYLYIYVQVLHHS